MYIDVNSNDSPCPVDAALADSPYGSVVFNAVSGLLGVLSVVEANCLGCYALAPAGNLLRWTFNVMAFYDADVVDLPFVLTEYDDGNPPAICGIDMLPSVCGFFADNMTTPVYRVSGSPDGLKTCNIGLRIYGLIDALSEPGPYLAAQLVGGFFLTNRSGDTPPLMRVDYASLPYIPGGASTIDRAALVMYADVDERATTFGRTFQGPDCPKLYDADFNLEPKDWPISSGMALGRLGELMGLRFRAYSDTDALWGLIVTLSVTLTPLEDPVLPQDIINLNWQCQYQIDQTPCNSAIGNWVWFDYQASSARLWVEARDPSCGDGKVDFSSAGALSLSDWVDGATVSAGPESPCTSPRLDRSTRIVGIGVTVVGMQGYAPSAYFLDAITLPGLFSVNSGTTFDSYTVDFAVA